MPVMMRFALFVAPFLALLLDSPALRASEDTPLLRASLHTFERGADTYLGLRLQPRTGWHLYWRNPGDSGEAPRVDWRLVGAEAGEVLWPFPEAIPFRGLMNYGYHGTLLLAAPLRGEPTAPAAVTVNWLVCREECIPGRSEVSATAAPEDFDALVERSWQRLPAALPTLDASWRLVDGGVSVEVYARERLFAEVSRLEFFPVTPDLVEYSSPAELRWQANRVAIRAPRNAFYAGHHGELEFLLVADRERAWRVSARFQPGP
jgi:thiol:disulfide interchange protein DsbD